MGEVYRARDTRVGRDIALKVLPDALASDPERLAGMHRDAQVPQPMFDSNLILAGSDRP